MVSYPELLRGLLQGLLGTSQGCLASSRTVCKDSQQLPSLVLSRIYIAFVKRKLDVPSLSHQFQMTDLRFKLESSYGRVRAYPVDQVAILLIRLAKSKTLLPQDIGTFSGLGYRCVDQDDNEITPGMFY